MWTILETKVLQTPMKIKECKGRFGLPETVDTAKDRRIEGETLNGAIMYVTVKTSKQVRRLIAVALQISQSYDSSMHRDRTSRLLWGELSK